MEKLATLAAELFGSLIKEVSNERSSLKVVFFKLMSHPIKLFAAYLTAPLHMYRLIKKTENPARRAIAIVGLCLSLILAYVAGGLLGTYIGFLFITTHVGFFTAIGFLIGTSMSFALTLIFSIIVFNFISFVFLKMSSQEVVDYLDSLSD